MNGYQIIALVVLAFLCVGSLIAWLRRWVSRREGLGMALVWLAAGVATAWPDVTSRVARALGIGRGADLVMYCAVVVMMIGFWMTYIRLRQLRREVTLLVRHLAIAQAEGPLSTDQRSTEESDQTRPS
jgi:hypothetical protein